jgi:hypothetical protein
MSNFSVKQTFKTSEQSGLLVDADQAFPHIDTPKGRGLPSRSLHPAFQIENLRTQIL